MNEYTGILRDEKETDLRLSLSAAVRNQPDTEAKLQKLSQRTGIALDAVRLNAPEVEYRDRLDSFDYERVIKENPKLSAWLADPKNAGVSHDDYDNLSAAEKLFTRGKDLVGAAGQGVVGQGAGSVVSGVSTLLDVAARGIDRPVRQVFGDRVADAFWYTPPRVGGLAIDPFDALKQGGQALKDIGKSMAPPKERENLATDVAQGVGQLSFQIAAYLMTGGTIATTSMFAQGADVMATKTEKDQVDSAVRDTAIVTGGAITAITEKFGLDKILNRVPPEIRNRTLRFIADKAAAGGIEAAQEFTEGLLHDITRYVMTNRDAPILEGVEREMTAAALSAAIVRTALGVRGYRQDKQQEEFFTALGDTAKASKLRERMPEKFRGLIEKYTADGPVANVYVPAAQFQQYFQSQNIDPLQIAETAGVTNYHEALATGGDLVIPMADFATVIAPTDHLQGLMQDMRLRQDEMTPREAKEFEQRRKEWEADILEQAKRDAGETQAPEFEQVKQQMLGELTGRFEPKTAEAYATYFAKAITTMAQRAGVSPLEMMQRYDPRVITPMPDVLRNTPDLDTQLDPILDRLRAGEKPRQKDAFGLSLSEFIRNAGGLRDSGETRDMDQATERRPGQRKMVQPDGMDLDRALQMAVEAGYFPDVADPSELTTSDLLDALGEDVRGTPRFSPANESAQADELRRLQAIEDYILEMGGDLATMDNATLKALIMKGADEMQDGQEYDQSATLRRGTETLKKYGLKPGGKYKTREVAAALEARQRAKYGTISATDRGPEALANISKWMAAEVEFEMQNPEKSGVGWYSEKFQRALDIMGDVFPELKDDKTARNTMTALIAITSDGQKVVPNFAQAMDIYGNFREGGQFTTTRGHQRQASIDLNLQVIQRLHDQMGPEAMHEYLMQEKTISELKKIAQANGGEMKSAYQAHIKMPMAAVEFGPKLGAFYANLMGAHGYLTMDRWWSRTFNRYRGTLLQAPTRQGLDRFKELIGKPEISDDEAIAATVEYRNSYEAKGFKNGTEIEKAANTLWKAAFDSLEDSPFNATDRTFMLDAVDKAQKSLARKGYKLSVADIQAILWYYEKRLYGELGARQTADISYEEAAQRVASSYATGSGIESLLDDEAATPDDGGADAGGVPVGEDTFVEGDSTLFQSDQRDLVVTHNLTAANLLHAVKMGGIPVPSLAVTKKDTPLTGFGEITLIGPPEMADPKGYAGTKVFGADIYSPRYPKITYELTPAKLKALKSDFAEGEKATGATIQLDEVANRGADELVNSAAVMWQFLTEQGVAPDVQMRSGVAPERVQRLKDFGFEKFFGNTDHQSLMRDEEFQRLAIAEQNDAYTEAGMTDLVQDFEQADFSRRMNLSRDLAYEMKKIGQPAEPDGYRTRDALRAQIRGDLDAEFKAYVAQKFEALGAKEKIFQGFSNSGNKRYTPHTLENVVKILKKELRGGEGFSYGVGSLRAKFTPQFKSVAEIRKNKDRLMDKASFEAVKTEVDNELIGIADDLKLSLDQTIEVLEDAPKIGVGRAIDRAFKDYRGGQAEASDSTKERIAKYLTRLRNLPTEYFEAKILREVSLSEFAGAVVPAGVDPKVIQALEDAGVKDIRTYSKGDEADRAAKIGEFEQVFFQSSGMSDKRGFIRFGENRKFQIGLLEKADLSTFLHETGHFWLEIMGDLAENPNSSQQVKDDYAAILNWFGVKNRSEITVEHHEMFARGNEAYLMEGKAPSAELRGLFQRFKAWLTMIYRSVSRLDVELSPQVRGVFDRIYATDEEIAAAQMEMEARPMFLTADEAGMSEAEFAAYQQSVGQATERAKEELQAKLMREFQREREAWWKERREGMRATVAAEIEALPEYQALSALVAGQTPDGVFMKLDREDLVKRYGAEYLKRLPRGFQRIYTASGGIDADTAAEMLGYPSGDDLVKALVNARPKNELIEAETDRRMTEEYGNMLVDGSIADEAMAALHNTEREKVLRMELRALNKEMASGMASSQMLRQMARGIIGQKQLRDLNPFTYLLAERKAARESFDLLTNKGNRAEAFNAKQRELLNHYLYLEATAAKQEADKIVDYLRSFEKDSRRGELGKAGADYLEQVDGILERYELKRVPRIRIQKREALAAWLNKMEAEGHAVAVPQELQDESRRVNYQQVNLDELRAVRDSVKNIAHLARLKNKLIRKGKLIDFEQVVGELIIAAEDSGLSSTGDLGTVSAKTSTMKERAAGLWRSFDAAHLKVEQLVEWLDSGKIDGPWARFFFDLADDAQTREFDMHRAVTQRIQELSESMPKEWRSSLMDRTSVRLPGFSKPMTRYDLLSIAFNMGNAQNLQRLSDGYAWGEAQMQQVRDALTAEDWRFVQGVWDTLETMWPEMAALEKRMSGLEPAKVEALPFEAAGQQFRGGYFPLVYDPRKSGVGEKQANEAESVQAFVSQGYGRAATSRGATKKRVEKLTAPLLLDFEQILTSHMAKVIKDISHREAIIGIEKILTNPQVKEVLIDRAGEAQYNQLRKWTQVLVADRSDTLHQASGFGKAAMVMRTNMAIVTMGWRISTMMAQFAGFAPSMDLVKPSYLAKAMIQSTKNPVQTFALMQEKSGEMRNRVATIDRDVKDALLRMRGEGGVLADIRRTAFYLTAMADRVVSVPTWIGAYNQALAEGKTDDDAIRAGDRAVRLSQGAGGAKDLAAVQRNNELMRLLTMYYTPFSVLYARLRDLGHQSAVQGIGYLPAATARMVALVALPAVLGELLAARGPEEDEDETWWAIRKMLLYPIATIPGIRDGSGFYESWIIAASGEGEMKYAPSYKFSPIVSAIEKVLKSPGVLYDTVTGERDLDTGLWDLFETSGYIFGLPTAQARVTGEYLEDLLTGDAEPENAPEMLRDLLYRRPKD
jgi:hypothetical protein